MVFQLAPGTGKSYVHAENVETSGMGPSGTGSDRILKFGRVAKIFEKNIGGVQVCTPRGERLHPPRCSRIKYSEHSIVRSGR